MKLSVNPAIDFLTRHIFELTFENGEVIFNTIKLQRNGTIVDHANPNELQTWIYNQDILTLFEHDGEVLAKFDVIEVDGSLVFSNGSMSVTPDETVLLKVSELDPTFQELVSHSFQFQIKNGAVLTRDFRLRPDMSIDGYYNLNERFWSIDETTLTIYNQNYMPTANYDVNKDFSFLSGEGVSRNLNSKSIEFELISLNCIKEIDEIINQPVTTLEDEVAFKIQNIVVPTVEESKTQAKDLYERGADIINNSQGQYINGFIDFNTYLNALSVHKWSKYSQAKSYTLQLKVNGKFKLSLVYSKLLSLNPSIREVGFEVAFKEIHQSKADDIFKRNNMNHLSNESEIQKDTFVYAVETQGTEILSIPIKMDSEASLVGFIIEGEAQIYEAGWYARVDKSAVRDIRIAINTTTFKKEEYILDNLEQIQEQIFDQHEASGLNALGAGHLFINVVDNGSTLDAASVNSKYIRVYANPNVGGAGGFSRGMIETLNLRKNGEYDATHVIFMDDDIDVLTESFKRVYALLSIIKPEYQDHFIEGAMLDNIDGITQYEDTGFITHSNDVAYMPVKTSYNLTNEKEVLRNDLEYPVDNEYGAWWFCTVPMKFIHENSMSLPIFYRGDDIEFSIRNQAKLITLNGLAVWHLPFYTKKSKALENYLVARNTFIDQSINGSENFASGVDFLGKYLELYKKEQRMFNYQAADQVLDALDDYLKGPHYIAEHKGIELILVENKKNEVFSEDIPEKIKLNLHTADEYHMLNPMDLKLFLETDNGHGFPEYSFNRFDDDLANVAVVNQEMLENPGKQFMKKRVVIYDTYNKAYCMRERNQEKYEVNEVRLKNLLAKFDAEGDAVAAAYQEAGKEFHTTDFWRTYLGLEA